MSAPSSSARRRTLRAHDDRLPACVQLALPTATAATVDEPTYPVAGDLFDVVGQRQGQVAGARRADDRGGEDVRGNLFEARRVAQHVVGGHVGQR